MEDYNLGIKGECLKSVNPVAKAIRDVCKSPERLYRSDIWIEKFFVDGFHKENRQELLRLNT